MVGPASENKGGHRCHGCVFSSSVNRRSRMVHLLRCHLLLLPLAIFFGTYCLRHSLPSLGAVAPLLWIVQEKAQEKEQQREQVQEVEREEFVDRMYSRDHEEPVRWPFDSLRQPTPPPALALGWRGRPLACRKTHNGVVCDPQGVWYTHQSGRGVGHRRSLELGCGLGLVGLLSTSQSRPQLLPRPAVLAVSTTPCPVPRLPLPCGWPSNVRLDPRGSVAGSSEVGSRFMLKFETFRYFISITIVRDAHRQR